MNRITILQVEVDKNRLTISFDCKGQIRKFFSNDKFIVEYDTSIEEVPEEILIIPFLITIAPIAWANQADIFVGRIDAIFLSSLITLERPFKSSITDELQRKNSSKQHRIVSNRGSGRNE